MSQNLMKPAPIELDTSHSHIIDIDFGFLTYVFGGGVLHIKESYDQQPTRPYDPITPVRSTGIRGALRMWWRFTTGVRCNTLEDMRIREQSMWGGVWNEDTPSQISLAVDTYSKIPTRLPTFRWVNDPKKNKLCLQATKKAEDLDYCTFPLRPKKKKSEGDDWTSSLWNHEDNIYRLSLSLFDLQYLDELKLAVSAWLTVGGYGGRTNRGFGAVRLVRCTDTGVTDDPKELRVLLDKLGSPRIEGVPALVADSENWSVRKHSSSAIEAWKTCLVDLQNFRQDRNRRSQVESPGRNHWPEPDAIRRLTRSSNKHKTPVSNIDAFPRADFGMPIGFQFNDSSDPPKQTLQPTKDVDRYPSPLILRPSSKGRAMAVRLANTTAPERPFLKGKNRHVRKTPTEKELKRAKDRERNHLIPDPISAFMNAFRD